MGHQPDNRPYVSIVIPAYNESRKIGDDIAEAVEYITAKEVTGEIIIVDDGSTDNTAAAAEHKNYDMPDSIELIVIKLPGNHGKGYAVRTGVKRSTGKYVIFCDAGCCVPYSAIWRGVKLIRIGECDIAHASRYLSETTIRNPQNLYRRLCSKAFRFAIGNYVRFPKKLSDTQCGFKIYKGDVARKLYSQCTTDGFMFDIEVILRAAENGFYIVEFPIEWTCDRDSRLTPARSLGSVLKELRQIKQELKQ